MFTMHKIEYNNYVRDNRNASSKAKQDVSHILSQLGYKKLYNPNKYRLVRVIQQFVSIIFLPKETELFIQYYSNYSFFYRLLRFKKQVRKIAIIHDMESLRQNMSIEQEVGLLNGFDYIISHNPKMTDYLKGLGVVKPLYDLNIFDYLLSPDIKINNKYDMGTVFFAGNLAKSFFLSKLKDVGNVHFNLYGAHFDGLKTITMQGNVSYKGSYSPEELIEKVEGGWGLVWDGESIDTCTGVTGEYLKYNNPHKISMCIVSERPVIVWRHSAMAKYVTIRNIGISIDSIYDISKTIKLINDEDYNKMLENVRNEKKRLVQGLNLKDVLAKINDCEQ